MLLLGPKCTCIGSRSMHLPWCIVHWHPSASFLEFLYVVRILKGRFIISPIKPLPNIGFPILSLPSLKRVFGGSRIVRKVNETHAVSLLRSSSLDPGGVDSHYLTWGLESIEVDIRAWKLEHEEIILLSPFESFCLSYYSSYRCYSGTFWYSGGYGKPSKFGHDTCIATHYFVFILNLV